MLQVLLPIGPDEERALAAAEIITDIPRASKEVQVTILNVQPEIEVTGEGAQFSSESWYDEEDLPSGAIKASEYLKNNNISVDIKKKHANPSEAIINFADESNADRIVMVGRKKTPTGKVLFGSVTQSVLINSNVPVTTMMSD